MLIDLKYHLTSLVAVFLALAVGMLVGSSFIGGSSVKGLEKEFVKLRNDNRMQQKSLDGLSEQVKNHKEFEAAAAPMLVKDKLAWRRVAIIQTGDYSEAAQGAKTILEEAGAKVVSVTTLGNLDLTNAHERISSALQLITGESGADDPLERMLEIVANCIATGNNEKAMDVLEDKELLSVAGEYRQKIFYIVLVGGDKKKGSQRAKYVDLVLIDKLKAAGVMSMVGAEPMDAKTSYIPVYHRKSIPTVDNVDLIMGKVGLVYALASGSGNYGIKKSAVSIAPNFTEKAKWP